MHGHCTPQTRQSQRCFVWANLEISKHLQRSREAEWQVERLDVALETAITFLDVLRIETVERIAEENLRLTESNLRLAQRREQVGISGRSDVYRWESRLATDRRRLLNTHAIVQAAYLALNRLLHRPQ